MYVTIDQKIIMIQVSASKKFYSNFLYEFYVFLDIFVIFSVFWQFFAQISQ